MVKKISFAKWMQGFENEDTTLGHLARTIKTDKTFPKRAKKKSSIVAFLYEQGVSIASMDAFERLWDSYTVSTSGDDSQEVAKDSSTLRNPPMLDINALKHYVVERIYASYGMAATARDANLHNVCSHHEGAYEVLLYVSVQLGITQEEFDRITALQKEVPYAGIPLL